MFVVFNKENIQFQPDNRSFTSENCHIWFKGYFFLGDQYYSDENAGKHLLGLLRKNELNANIGECNGVFTAVIIDKEKSEIHIMNDRFGFGHLFFHHTNSRMIISDNFWLIQKEIGAHEFDIASVTELLQI